MSTTELEKQSLEAHVDLCAERYGNLKSDIDEIKTRLDGFETELKTIGNAVSGIHQRLEQKENSVLRGVIKVGGSIILALSGGFGAVVWYIITKQ